MDNYLVNEDVVRTVVTLLDDGYVVRIYSESPDHEPISAFILSDEQASELASRLISRDVIGFDADGKVV